MSGAKPWQIALIVIGLLAGAAGVVYAISTGGPPKTADQITVVDVTSGELFNIPTKNRTLAMPMKRPGGNDYVLYPVERGDAGEWRVVDRYFSVFIEQTTDTPPVDRETGVVSAVGEPRSL